MCILWMFITYRNIYTKIRECSSIQKVIIPSTVTSIGSYAFDQCYKLAHITIPESVTMIGECAFYECTSLSSIFLPSSLKIIKSHAFYGCSSLTQINIPKSVDQICKGFMKLCTSLLTIKIPSSIRIIESYSFSECSSLAQVSIETPSLLRKIEKCAFYQCSSLAQIKIPSSVISIGNNTFERCSSLTNIEFEIPSSLKTIGRKCFAKCKSLIQLLILSSVTSYELQSFKEYKLLTQITIPSSVTSIGIYAFNKCSSLAQITIPSSVTSIGTYAFCGCSSLTQITIPSSVTSIGNYAFNGCSLLTQIIIPSSVTQIGLNTFLGCSSLTQITIPPSVTSIGNSAFSKCSSLTQIIIPSSVTEIGDYAFSECSTLIQVSIPSTITQFGTKIFEGISKVRVVGDITIIPYNLFSDCESLTKVSFFSPVKTVEDYAFYNCTSLQQVIFENPSPLISIGNFVFYYCFSLKEITIPYTIKSIGDYSFYISPNNLRGREKVLMIKEDDFCEHYLVEDKKSKKLFDEIIFYEIINYSKATGKQILYSLFSIIQFNYPLIQKYYEFNESKNDIKFYLLTEYFNQRNLREIFENKEAKMNDTQKLINIYGIALAMSYLHSNEILHYDLNPSNILEDEEYHPKIINCGIKNICKKKGLITFNTLEYSSMYNAPEFYNDNKYDKSSEVYAFSLILYEIVTNKKPFEEITLIEHLKNINEKKRPKLDDSIREPYRNLIERCWSEIPERRPTFESIVKELRENLLFITDKIDFNEFKKYINFIDLSIIKAENQKEIEKNKIKLIKNEKKNISTISFIPKEKIEKLYHDKYSSERILQKMINKCLNSKEKKPSFSYIINSMQYVPLKQIIREKPPEWNNTKRLINIYGIALYMKYFHSRNLVHRELNLGIVFVDSDLYPRLADPNTSIKTDEEKIDDSVIGPTSYIAPEIWNRKHYSKSSDVYAFGFLVYELMTNNFPFEGLNDEQVCYQIAINHFKPNFGEIIDHCYKNLIEKCLDENKDKRPSFEWIVEELRNNKGFIINDVDVEEFKKYIEFSNDPLGRHLHKSKNSRNINYSNVFE